MAFEERAFVHELQTHDPVVITNYVDLPSMEDALVTNLLPIYAGVSRSNRVLFERNWAARERLVDAIKPHGYHGMVKGISVQLFPEDVDPIDVIAARPKNHRIQRRNAANYAGNIVGMTLVAQTTHNKPFTRGIWYIRTPISAATATSRTLDYIWRRAVSQ